MLPYDVVVFDLDGTLTDSRPGIFACAEYALKKMGRPVPPESVMGYSPTSELLVAVVEAVIPRDARVSPSASVDDPSRL